MHVLSLPISELMPGMLVAESIRNQDTGLIYVTKNQPLTTDIIKKLSVNSVTQVTILVNTWDDVWKISEDTKKHYKVFTDQSRQLLTDIANTHQVNLSEFNVIKESLKDYFNDNHKIIGCINLFKIADNYTYTHSINVALLSNLIGKWMNYGKQAQEDLMLGGLLHDIGKMKIPMEILNKPGHLTNEEFEEIKKHPIYSYELLQPHKEIPLDVKVGILMHHERIDGSGYPYGVYNENINIIAKVIAIADAYDAMISDKPYQQKRSPFEVMQLMQEGIFGKLDSKILLTFLSNIATYYIGTYVALSNGEIGEVVAINPTCVYRPILRVNKQYIDMNTDFSVSIVDLI